MLLTLHYDPVTKRIEVITSKDMDMMTALQVLQQAVFNSMRRQDTVNTKPAQSESIEGLKELCGDKPHEVIKDNM